MLSRISMLFVLHPPGRSVGEFDIDDYRIHFTNTETFIHHARMRKTVCDRFIRLCCRMTPALEAELAAMSYNDFLQTDYWVYLRDYTVMIRGVACEACHRVVSLSAENLEVHHLSYERRGSEWRHPEDLKVVCRNCHEKEHIRGEGGGDRGRERGRR